MDELKATNPRQYDAPELDWRLGGAEDRTSRIYFREQLERVVAPGALSRKRVLDIGSGVGQLFNWLKEKGAKEVVGFDPSERNIKTSKEKYPWATSVVATLNEFATANTEKFDAAFAVLVFEHIENMDEAFQDIRALLKNEGEFYLIITDKDFNLIQDRSIRGKRFVSQEVIRELENGVVESKTVRDEGEAGITVMYDLFRPTEHVLEAAKKNNFQLVEHLPIIGPYTLPLEERKYLICHLLTFKN